MSRKADGDCRRLIYILFVVSVFAVLVKSRVCHIEVFAVKLILSYAECIREISNLRKVPKSLIE